MAAATLTPTPAVAVPADRRTWTAPRLAELPKLTALTLASAIGGGGGTGSGGSTVFGILLALSALVGCSSDWTMEPGAPVMPKTVASIECRAEVAERRVSCGGPLAAPGREIVGGQGVRVFLRSTGVAYDEDTDKFTFDVSVQNLSAQSIGTNGTFITNVYVYFEEEPVATAGSGAIAVDNASYDGTFTGSNQVYYTYADSLHNLQTSAPQGWQFDVPGTVDAFSFSVLIAADVPEYGGLLHWKGVTGLTNDLFFEVAASGPDDALAIGDAGWGTEGLAARFNGSTWTTLTRTTDDGVRGLTAIGYRDYLAGGSLGRVWRNTGGVWAVMHERADFINLIASWNRGPDHFVLAGENGAVSRYDDGVWNDEVIGAGAFETSYLTGTPDGDLVTVVDFFGVNWTSTAGGPWVEGDTLGNGAPIYAVAYDDAGHLLIGTVDAFTGRGVVVADGTDTLLAVPNMVATKLYPFDDDSLIAQVVDLTTNQMFIIKITWGEAPAPGVAVIGGPFDFFAINGARLDAAGTQFIIPDLGSGGLWGVDGSAAVSITNFLGCGCFSDVWGIGDTAYVVDGSNQLWTILGDGATAALSVPGATQVTGISSTDLYAVVGSQVWQGNGADGFTPVMTVTDDGSGFNDIVDIWADPASERVIAVVAGSRWVSRDGGTWTEHPQVGLGVPLTAVWGCSATEAWIAGGDGNIYKLDGASIAVDPAWTLAGFPVADHKAMAGTSCNDIWVGGVSGSLYHWNGTEWTDHSITTLFPDFINIWALHSRGPGVVYVGGNNGQFAIVSAAGGITRTIAPTMFNDINALWALDNGEVISVDDEHVLRGMR